MSKKSKRTRNDISMAFRIDSLPRRIRKQDFFRTLLDFLDGEIEELPEGWEITWRWQNSKKQKWREEEFSSTVGNSRDSFMTLMRRRLQRDLDKLSPAKRAPAKRKKRSRKAVKKRKRSRKMSKGAKGKVSQWKDSQTA